jgi:tetratricopeptide (TPR) repeat protein
MNPSPLARSIAEVALARGEGHRADGRLEAAELAYFEAAGAAAAASDAAQAARHVMMRARIGLGRIELTRGSPDRALGWFLNAREIAPHDWQPLYWQGCAQGWLGDYPGADRSFTAALRLNPSEPSIAIQQLYARFKMGDLTVALDDVLAADRPSPADEQLATAPLLVGLTLLVAGRRRQAGACLEEALRRDPANNRVLHAVSAFWLNGGQESVAVPVAIAATAALVNDESFWERFRSSAASRYQAAVAPAAIVECRRHVERLAYTRAGPSHEHVLLRETTAAGVLRDLGGLPSGGDRPALLMCGPVMISLLHLEHALSDFVAQQPAHDEPQSNLWQRLRLLFSSLGVATALLRAQRPEEALDALGQVACERCRSANVLVGYPKVCGQTCPDFDVRNPSYARLPAKSRRLAEDAARLSITAQLDVARRIVAADPDDLDTAIRLWADAVRVSAVVQATEQTQRQIVDTVLGRAKTLEKRDHLEEAIALLEAAEQVLEAAPAGDEVRSQLGQLLTDRGVISANSGDLEHALDDLRRAARCSPHASRPLINLSLALQRLADQRRGHGDHAGAYERLREAKHVLEDARSNKSGSPEFEQQLASVRKELRTLCNHWAIELAATARYEEALEVLSQGLTELPDDAQLRHSHQSIGTVAADRGRRQAGS